MNEQLAHHVRRAEETIDATGTLPSHLLQEAFDEKLFKLFVPKALNGREEDLVSGIRIFEEASRLNGSFGWLVTIGTGGNAFVPYFEKEQCEERFSKREAVIAGSGFPAGKATWDGEAYRVNGTWLYCSGSPYASMFTANCLVEGGPYDGNVRSFIMDPDEVMIEEDWDAIGLKGTGSHTIHVKDAVIPLARTFFFTQLKNEYRTDVQTFPFLPFSQASFMAVVLGVADRFYEEMEVLVNNRLKDERKRRAEQLLLEGNRQLQTIHEQFYAQLKTLWRFHTNGRVITKEEMEHFSNNVQRWNGSLVNQMNDCMPALGMHGLLQRTALNRAWRDAMTASQHTYLVDPIDFDSL